MESKGAFLPCRLVDVYVRADRGKHTPTRARRAAREDAGAATSRPSPYPTRGPSTSRAWRSHALLTVRRGAAKQWSTDSAIARVQTTAAITRAAQPLFTHLNVPRGADVVAGTAEVFPQR